MQTIQLSSTMVNCHPLINWDMLIFTSYSEWKYGYSHNIISELPRCGDPELRDLSQFKNSVIPDKIRFSDLSDVRKAEFLDGSHAKTGKCEQHNVYCSLMQQEVNKTNGV